MGDIAADVNIFMADVHRIQHGGIHLGLTAQYGLNIGMALLSHSSLEKVRVTELLLRGHLFHVNVVEILCGHGLFDDI